MEIEVKIIEINKEEIIKKILLLGGRKIFDGEVESFAYDFSNKSIKNSGGHLRLRRLGEINQVTFKEKRDSEFAKVVEEIETTVKDLGSIKEIFKKIGLIQKDYQIKHRLSFVLGKVHIDIDTIQGIPTFLEIEAKNEKTIKEYLLKLGFKLSDAKNWSNSRLLEYYDTRSSLQAQ